jgi:hypothetical protein
MFSVEKPYKKVVDNFIILLVLKFDSHKSDRLGVMLFTNSVTESVQFLYRFQKLHCLLKFCESKGDYTSTYSVNVPFG